MNNPEENAILKALVDSVCYREQQVPPGFLTTREWCERLGMYRGNVGKVLNAGIDAGTVEKIVLRRKLSGAIRQIPYFRVKMGQKKKG